MSYRDEMTGWTFAVTMNKPGDGGVLVFVDSNGVVVVEQTIDERTAKRLALACTAEIQGTTQAQEERGLRE